MHSKLLLAELRRQRDRARLSPRRSLGAQLGERRKCAWGASRRIRVYRANVAVEHESPSLRGLRAEYLDEVVRARIREVDAARPLLVPYRQSAAGSLGLRHRLLPGRAPGRRRRRADTGTCRPSGSPAARRPAGVRRQVADVDLAVVGLGDLEAGARVPSPPSRSARSLPPPAREIRRPTPTVGVCWRRLAVLADEEEISGGAGRRRPAHSTTAARTQRRSRGRTGAAPSERPGRSAELRASGSVARHQPVTAARVMLSSLMRDDLRLARDVRIARTLSAFRHRSAIDAGEARFKVT